MLLSNVNKLLVFRRNDGVYFIVPHFSVKSDKESVIFAVLFWKLVLTFAKSMKMDITFEL